MVFEATPTGRDAIDLYRRTYTTILRSSGEVRLRALIPAHVETESSLHFDAGSSRIDTGALLYAVNRLPKCITQIDRVLLGQMAEQFTHALGVSIDDWQKVSAPGRRRIWHFDGARTLAVHIASPSDLDDVVPTLVAYEIEWGKLHDRLVEHRPLRDRLWTDGALDPALLPVLQEAWEIPGDDWQRLVAAWGDDLGPTLRCIAGGPKELRIRLIGGTHVAYAKLIRRWWERIGAALEARGLANRPIYFVSSNTHSLVNLVSGHVHRHRAELIEFLDSATGEEAQSLRGAWDSSNQENVLYYAARLWADQHSDPAEWQAARTREEEERGIWWVGSTVGVDVDAQIIELGRLHVEDADPRLADVARSFVRSDAVIVNISYPLGLAAYRILREVAEATDRLVGVYVVGKAATLNGAIGDVMVSDVIYDEHSRNLFSFPNALCYQDIAPYLCLGSVLDNQKAVTVRGTFLQNRAYLDLFYQEYYTVVEMEAGPFLAAVYEATFPTRHPVGENLHFRDLRFDLGIVHYASDTPYTRARTLGGRSLSFEGIDSTYASVIAVVRRIAHQERVRRG